MLNTAKNSKMQASLLVLVLLSSCISMKSAGQRLAPPRPTREFRIEQIEDAVDVEPEKAIHLIGMFDAMYGGEGIRDEADGDSGGRWRAAEGRLAALWDRAVQNLTERQVAAVAEKRWDDATSLERSLSALGISVENGTNGTYLLAEAKEYLDDGNDLAAFLTAVRAEQYGALEAADAVLFLERAVTARQRRTAAHFLNLAGSLHAVVPENLRAYAEGRDSPADMIKGVATVIVDRGIKVERGRGFNDRVLGSAFFVDASGLLVTNYHVIASEVDPTYEGYSRMYIRMGDATSPRIPAKVVGWDKTLDLALIKTEYKSSFVFSVVDRISPNVGDTILAIGSPVGLEKTVTMGIVSATGRRLLQIGDVIQVDAAVNHGNSGGPVIDMEGRLVGIVFAGIEQFPGLNFAVPAERLAAALPAMIRGGKAKRPWLGLTLAETSTGAEILYVAPLTPAAELHVPDGVPVKSLNRLAVTAERGGFITALQDSLFQNRPGELVALETGDGRLRVMQSVERPALPLAEAAKVDSRERITAPLFGIVLEDGMSGSFRAPFLIKKVVRGSVADEAGLSAQDPLLIRGFKLNEKEGYVLLDISVKKRLSGYFETNMQLPAALDSPDTL
ncbi:MAG: S1C family serine protease [Spirochaetaceae bacterium]|nr:S1C family serine protease [Spirochaetaceae bacterium]